MSRQPLAITSPSEKITILVVPPPMSRLAVTQCSRRLAAQAPLPFPAMTDSRSGPAVETTNSPARTLSRSSTAAAFSFRADSPVMITAPVSTSAGVKPARRYASSAMRPTASPSTSTGESSGVRYTSLR